MQRSRSISEDRSSRPSRIAVKVRTPSLDRLHPSSAHLNAPLSSLRGSARSPQNTPLQLKSVSKRSLFTPMEKHNDKRYITERAQRITEYLMRAGGYCKFDFLARGLRQLTIKQFVAIINFFLSHIWGERYTVGTNHVEDIINILQKLRYPYPVNKSWLKTPNTVHSYGNVIVLFDFLMEFAPDSSESPPCLFELQEYEYEYENKSDINGDLRLPDLQFQQQLLSNCAEGFPLWDKKMPDNENALKQQICDLLILKVSGLKSRNALKENVSHLRTKLEALKRQRLPDNEMKALTETRAQLANELKDLKNESKSLMVELEKYTTEFAKLRDKEKMLITEVAKLEEHNDKLEKLIKSQLYSAEQRNNMIIELDHLKYFLAIEKRAISDLETRSNTQQVRLSKVIKQKGDEIEAFNTCMRDLVNADLSFVKMDIAPKLQLPVRCERKHLEQLLPILASLKSQAQQRVEVVTKKLHELERSTSQMSFLINNELIYELNILRSQKATNERDLEQLNEQLLQKTAQSHLINERLMAETTDIQRKIDECKEQRRQMEEQLVAMKSKNEEIMARVEHDHKVHMAQRSEFLGAYDAALTECIESAELQVLGNQLGQLSEQIEKLNTSLSKQFDELNRE